MNNIDSIINNAEELIQRSIRNNSYLLEYRAKRNRDNALNVKKEIIDWKKEITENLYELESIEKYHDKLSQNPDSILSAKYMAKYSLKNPLLDTRQTFNNLFYTNSKQTEFIKEENID